MSYNGWTNYETWLVNLWLDNDGAQMSLAETCEEMYPTKEDFNLSEFADVVRDYVDQIMDAQGISVTGMFSDLLGAALSSVDWREIADHYAEDLPETEDEPI